MAYEFNHYYELQNVATGKYVNVLGNHEDGTVKNGEAVNLFNRTNNPDQRWALENYGGNGNVRIVLQRGEGWYALNYNTRNANCIVWHLNTADDIDTVIRRWWWTRRTNYPMPPARCTRKHYPSTTWMNCAFYYNRRTTRILPDSCGRRSLRCRSPARRDFPSCEEKRANRSCLRRSAALRSSTV